MEDRVDLVIFDYAGNLVESEVPSIGVDQRGLAGCGRNLSQGRPSAASWVGVRPRRPGRIRR